MLDFEEFRFLAENACVVVAATKSIATVTATSVITILLRSVAVLSCFIVPVTGRYSTIYQLSNLLVYFNLTII